MFAAIEKHQKAMRELQEALKMVQGTLGPDPKKEKKYGDLEWTARAELTSTAPTTLQGLLALFTYINGVTNGPLSPYGKRDNTFEEFESLTVVLANAEELLSEQIGRAA
ncbi:hypothetical protein CQ12_05620 [Bradyrhizobium jicamae]|uniref:Uncharacterized protein n=1 Tax=Bradyrhizobium jicamae TaxID=280332 RepID=A0A0R3LTD0_9BRAD|nr:hypothetical protein CQ12_05620 [Bradyrhizobium jicamae]